MKLDVLSAVEACYAGPATDEAWLAGLLEALAPLEQGPGMYAQLFSVKPGGERVIEATALSPTVDPAALQRLERAYESDGRPSQVWDPGRPVVYALRRAAQAGLEREVKAYFKAEGLSDALGIFAAEPDGRVAMVTAARAFGAPRLAPRTLHQLKLLSAHIGAGMRLRRAAGAAGAGPEAILDRRGKVLHAADDARTPAARGALAEAVRRIGMARGALRATDPDEALELWQGLVEGSWSLVDHVDSDGKRLVLARRNEPGVRDPKALTAPERFVLAFVAMGHQNKFVAYELGLSPSAVAAHLRSAQRKLGVSSRAELVQLFASLARAGARGGGAQRPPARRAPG